MPQVFCGIFDVNVVWQALCNISGSIWSKHSRRLATAGFL